MAGNATPHNAATPLDKLLRGEITPEEYVASVRRRVREQMRQIRTQKWGSW